MGEAEGPTLYKCVVCGKAFTKLQSLMAHMRVHRDIEWARLSVRLPKSLVEEFKELAKRHNTTTCQLIHSMLTALIEGEKRGVVQIGSSNPVIINLVNVFNARPRGHGKYDFSALVPDDQTCSLCNRRAVWACADTYGKELLLCDRHAWLRHQFEVFRRI